MHPQRRVRCLQCEWHRGAIARVGDPGERKAHEPQHGEQRLVHAREQRRLQLARRDVHPLRRRGRTRKRSAERKDPGIEANARSLTEWTSTIQVRSRCAISTGFAHAVGTQQRTMPWCTMSVGHTAGATHRGENTSQPRSHRM
eukprot:7101486-Prymnesium_polylepis.1